MKMNFRRLLSVAALILLTLTCVSAQKKTTPYKDGNDWHHQEHNDRSHDAEVQMGIAPGIGVGDKTGVALGLDLSIGSCPSNSVCFGFGGAIRYARVLGYKECDDNEKTISSSKGGRVTVPVFCRFKYKLNYINTVSSLVEPYFQFDLGYSFKITSSNSNPVIRGPFVEPSLGICRNRRTLIGVGMNMQGFHYTKNSGGEDKDIAACATCLTLHVSYLL